MESAGFANLPNELHRHALQQGFSFTVMAVGEAGLGKSTLLNTLLACDVAVPETYPPAGRRIPATARVTRSTSTVEEDGVRVQLTVVDTPGFGNAVDNTDCWRPVLADLEGALAAYMDAEAGVARPAVAQDSRVHACLYFLAPTGRGLKPLDVAVLRRLAPRVNVIPVIAKGDSLTPAEAENMKAAVRRDLAAAEISVYQFPAVPLVDGDEPTEAEAQLASPPPPPFVVCGAQPHSSSSGGSNSGRRIREYPWGTVDVEAPAATSDLALLRTLLLRQHTLHLVDSTHARVYESYRRERMAAAAATAAAADGGTLFTSAGSGPSAAAAEALAAQLEVDRVRHEAKLQRMGDEMSLVFSAKVKEKTDKLRAAEEKLLSQHEAMQRDLDAERAALEAMRREFDAEKAAAAAGPATTKKKGLFS